MLFKIFYKDRDFLKKTIPLLSKIFVAAFLFLSFFVISCENSINTSDGSSHKNKSSSTAAQASSVRYASVYGSYSTSDAMPAQIAASLYSSDMDDYSRSAIANPDSANNNTRFYVIARDVTEGKADSQRESPVSGQVNESDNTYIVTGLKIGVTWQIEVGIEVKNGDATEWQPCIFGKTQPKAFTDEDNTLTENLILKSSVTGNGSIDLTMSVDSTIDYFHVILPSEQLETWQTAIAADADNVCNVNGTSARIKIKSIPAGVYNVGLGFYKENGLLAFYTEQTVCVVNGMLTETWCSNGSTVFQGSGLTTSFNVSGDVINDYVDTVIYVGQNSYATSIGVTARNSNEGRAYSPFENFQGVVNKITRTASARDYKIFVSGTITGAQTLTNSITTANASSITIAGLTGLDNAGNPQDVLNGNNDGSTLTIATSVPVKIKNLQITGGSGTLVNSNTYGGGIYVTNESAKVSLEGGILIGKNSSSLAQNQSGQYGNKAEIGAGIYSKGELTVKGAKICCNYGGGIAAQKKLKITNSEIKYNYEHGFYLITCEADIINCDISWNESLNDGGGIYIEEPDEEKLTTITGSTISHNIGSGGGGIYSFDSTVKIHNTVIEDNEAYLSGYDYSEGGGIKIDFSEEGRGIELSGNTVIRNNIATAGGGAIYSLEAPVYIKDQVYIPAGNDNSNDVFFGSTDAHFIVNGSLNPPAAANGLIAKYNMEPDEWHRGDCYVKADNVHVTNLTNYESYFMPVDSEWFNKVSSQDVKKLILNSPIYVAGAGHSSNVGDGSVSGNGTRTYPYNSINTVVNAGEMSDSNLDYKIIIDGNITGAQVIPSTVTAASIILEGANSFTSDDGRKDILNGNGENSALTINKSTTLKNIKITGGSASNGGGINLAAGSLTLEEDVLISGNTASSHGGGVYISTDSTASLNVKGNVVISGNTNENLYLSSGKKINVTGALVKGSGSSAKKSDIRVTTADLPAYAPAPASPTVVTFTNGYGYASGGYNASVNPWEYFRGDTYGVNLASNEVTLNASGGVITVEDFYKDIKISVDKTWISTSDFSKKIYVSAVLTENGTETDLLPTGDDPISYSYKLYTRGDEVGSNRYGSGRDGDRANISLTNVLEGKYTLKVTGVYKGRTYSASFAVNVGKGEVDVPGITTSATLTSSSMFNGRTHKLPRIIAIDHEVTAGEFKKYCTHPYASFANYENNQPAGLICWYDALVYCNKRSMAEGLEPVYSLNGSTDPADWPGVTVDGSKYKIPQSTSNYTSDYDNVVMVGSSDTVITTANGWRLPTEVEWEYLALGGVLDGSGPTYIGGNNYTDLAWCYENSDGKTHEVRTKTPNSLKLYDMAGNVGEWCWDNYDAVNTSTPITGSPAVGTDKAFRGGYFQTTAEFSDRFKPLTRDGGCTTSARAQYCGFRIVRSVR